MVLGYLPPPRAPPPAPRVPADARNRLPNRISHYLARICHFLMTFVIRYLRSFIYHCHATLCQFHFSLTRFVSSCVGELFFWLTEAFYKQSHRIDRSKWKENYFLNESNLWSGRVGLVQKNVGTVYRVV